MNNFKGLPRRFDNLLSSFTPEQKERLVGSSPRLINEELENFCNDIPSKELVGALKQLTEAYNVINSLEKTDGTQYDQDSAIVAENWNFFTNALKELASYPAFQEKSNETYCKLYAIKFFTKGDFVDNEALEDNLKHAVKLHFSKLLTNDPKEFTETFFKLPLDFVGLAVRYIVNTLAPKERENLVPIRKEAEAYLENLLEKKKSFIETLGKIVNDQNNVLSFTDAKLLVDTRSFVEELEVHDGILEYLTRLLNDKTSAEKLSELFGTDSVRELKQNILAHPNYKKYLRKIKHSEVEPFFNLHGLPNEKRIPSFADVVEEYVHPELSAIRKAEDEEASKEAELEGTLDMSTPTEEPSIETPEEVPAPEPSVEPTPSPKHGGNMSAEIPPA